MASLRRWLLRLLNAIRPARGERELAREITAHLDLLTDEYRRRGLPLEEARRAARRAFGGVELAKERHRDARSFVWVDDAQRDLTYAARTLRRAPGFAAVAVATLALGIGANAAIFSIVRAVLLNPLPYRNASRLVRPYENVPAAESPNRRPMRLGGMDLREMLELRERSRTLAYVVSGDLALVTMMGAGDPALVTGGAVSAGTFSMLGVPPALGRWFSPEEEKEGRHVVILSHDLWLRDFAADPDVLRRTVTFASNSSSFTGGITPGTGYAIVGVMPRGFHFNDDVKQFWVPAILTRPTDRGIHRVSVMAQLREGVSIEQAAAELTAIATSIRGTSASGSAWSPRRFELVRVQDEAIAPVKSALLVLMGAVGFVLLIACANVANLLMARAAARQREIAVRISIGAGRGRLIRQMLTESVLLAALGGAAGTGLAFGGIRLFRALATNLSRFDLGTMATFPRFADIAIDAPVFLFVSAVSLVTGIAFGLAPAFASLRGAPADALRDAIAGPLGGPRGSRLQNVLVVVEVATAMVLFVGGALLIRSFVGLAAVDLGFDPQHTLTFQVGSGDRNSSTRAVAVADQLVTRLRSMPGVVAAGYARQLPMVQLEDTLAYRTTAAIPPDGPAPDGGADSRFVSPGYLAAVGARLITGRWPAEPTMVLINRTLANRAFPDESPIGKVLYFGRSATPHEIAGVVDDARWYSLDRLPRPQVFADLSQWTGPARNLLPLGPYYVVRTAGDPTSALPDIRSVVRQLEPEAPIYNIATLEQIVSNSVTLPRMYAVLMGVFAALAVGLALVGIYGMMAHVAVRRTREIGIRMALGARRSQVYGLMLRQSAALTVSGTVIGLAGAAALSRSLQGLLFGVTPLDAGTFATVSLAFLTIAIFAAYLPGSRAARVDPAITLRCE